MHHLSTRLLILLATALLAVAALPARADTPDWLSGLEHQYRAVRELRDAIDVTRYRGAQATPEGVPLTDLLARYATERARLAAELTAEHPVPEEAEDQRALAVMWGTLARELVEEKPVPTPAPQPETPNCDYAPAELAEQGNKALQERMYACFAAAAGSLPFEGETLDRLTVFARLALDDSQERRRRLWLALQPVWRAVNGDNGPDSPYRVMVRHHATQLDQQGQELGEAVRGIGVEPAQMQAWLLQVLARWRDTQPDSPVEPWDFYWQAGAAARELAAAVPVAKMREIDETWYRGLGADPDSLNVHYDLEPRAGKDPVAFTTFGRRPRPAEGGWDTGEPWVFATYRTGGLDHLYELLHETGHAVHIAAIRARPAFEDWPDSDIFTEGIADIAALDVFDPDWQQRYLGASAPAAEDVTARFASTVMDVAWALFELRLYRHPEADPNTVWTAITHEYLHIAPHPEYSWWAVRGQLVDAPGYMLNYAAGAILVSDLRARVRELWGSPTAGDPDWYRHLSEGLYRYGLAKPSAEVIEEFLGRPVSPDAILAAMGRGAADAQESSDSKLP